MKMLNMQLLRDLRSQWSRYLASALLILLGIVVSAGMAAGNGSALNTAKDAQDTGNVEDGYLELTAELTNDQLTSLRNKGLTFERAEFTDVPAADNSTVRVYENRSTIDRINLESGALPTANDEIALEQTYARAHNLKVGDTLDLDGTRLTITGIGSTPDYATVVARPTDTAADPNEFGTAFTAASTVESLAKRGNTLTTTYVYLLGDSDMEASDIVSEISNALRNHTGTAQVSSYLEHDDNPRIVTVIDDQTVTVQAAYIAGFVALVLIAYVLSVLTADNIRRQSPVIGTFYALGITRRELIAHYMLLPVILAAVCAVAGTVGGFLAAPAMQNATTYYSIPRQLPRPTQETRQGAATAASPRHRPTSAIEGDARVPTLRVQLPPTLLHARLDHLCAHAARSRPVPPAHGLQFRHARLRRVLRRRRARGH